MKRFLTVLTVLCLMCCACGCNGVEQGDDSSILVIPKTPEEVVEETVNGGAMDVQFYFENCMQYVTAIANSEQTVNFLKSLTQIDGFASLEDYESVKTSLTGFDPVENDSSAVFIAGFTANGLIAEPDNGTVLSRQADGWDYQQAAWFKGLGALEGAYISNLHASDLFDGQAFSVVAPVYDAETNEMIGAFGCEVPVASIPQLMVNASLEGGILCLVSYNLKVLYHANTTYMLQDYSQTELYQAISDPFGAQTGMSFSCVFEGKQVLGCVAEVLPLEARLVAIYDADSAPTS